MPFAKKLLLLLMLSVVTVLTSAKKKQEVVLVGDDAYAPYSYLDENRVARGIAVDLLNEISQAMPNFSIKVLLEPWKRALFEVEKNNLIGIFPPYKNPELRPWMIYSSPLYAETAVVLCNMDKVKNRPGKVWPQDFSGLVVGNNVGFITPGLEFFKMVKEGKIKVEEVRTTESNLRKLVLGRIDCYVNDRLAIDSELKRLKLDRSRIAEYAIVSIEPVYVGFNNRSTRFRQQEIFIKEFNETVDKLRKEGRLRPLGI